MTTWTATVLTGGVWVVGYRLRPRGLGRAAAAATGLTLAAPMVGLPIVLAAAAWSTRGRMRGRRRAVAEAEAELPLLVHGLAVAVSAGHGALGALASVEARLTTSLRDNVAAVRQAATNIGIGAALATSSGPAAPLFRQLAAAHLSGAAIGPALTSFGSELHARRVADAQARARRAPVLMVVPMTLLMLPGFVLLLVGPTVITTIGRLFAGGP